MIALKLVAASALTTLMLATAPVASAEPPSPVNGCNDIGPAEGCQVPRQANKPKQPPRVSGCVRGVCVLKPRS